VLSRVTELVVEFSLSAYMTDPSLSRLKRIPKFGKALSLDAAHTRLQLGREGLRITEEEEE
jgi:hypothetical protein